MLQHVATCWNKFHFGDVWDCSSKSASAFVCLFIAFLICCLWVLWLDNLAHSGTLVSPCFYSLTPPCPESSTANTLKKQASEHLPSDEGLDGLDWLRQTDLNSECWSFMMNAEIQETLKTLESKRCILYTADISCIESFRMHFSICLFWTKVRWVQTTTAIWILSGLPVLWPNGCQEACPKISQQSHLKYLAQETGLDLANWPCVSMFGNNTRSCWPKGWDYVQKHSLVIQAATRSTA